MINSCLPSRTGCNDQLLFWSHAFRSISVLSLCLSSNWAHSIGKDKRLATLAVLEILRVLLSEHKERSEHKFICHNFLSTDTISTFETVVTFLQSTRSFKLMSDPKDPTALTSTFDRSKCFFIFLYYKLIYLFLDKGGNTFISNSFEIDSYL